MAFCDGAPAAFCSPNDVVCQTYVAHLFSLWDCLYRIGVAMQRRECRGKAFQAIANCASLPGATLRLPPVTYIGKPMCTAFQAGLSLNLSFSGCGIRLGILVSIIAKCSHLVYYC